MDEKNRALPSAARVLALIRERTRDGPWDVTISEAAASLSMPPRTFQWAVSSLKKSGLVEAVATRGNLTTFIAVTEQQPQEQAQDNGATATQPQRATTTRLARSFETTNGSEASSFVSSSILTTNNDEASKASGETAREATAMSNRNEQPQTAMGNRNARHELTEMYLVSLDLARENGRLEAEVAYLRERLARLETPCTTHAPLPTPSTSAPLAGTRGSVTAPSVREPTGTATSIPETASPAGPSTPVAPRSATGATGPSAAPSPSSAAPLHPANRRDDPLPPAPSADDAEDQRLFLELAAEHGLSEQAAEAELIRAWSIGRPLHEAIAAVWLIRESGGELEAPWAFLWTVLNRANKYPLPEGVASRWSEIKGPWLAVAKARNKKREAKAAKAEAKVSAEYPMNLDRPLGWSERDMTPYVERDRSTLPWLNRKKAQ